MAIWVMDIEANGFLEELDTIHCAHFSSLDGKTHHTFTPDNIEDLPEFMDKARAIICHNFIEYDRLAVKKVFGYWYEGKIVDTLVMSRLLEPKRRLPPHAKDKKQGPHSLYAWGVRVGVDKPEHHDWEVYSEEMLHRCKEDVEINRLTYLRLLEEMKGGEWKDAMALTHKLFENLQKQYEYGWYVDREHIDKSLSMLTHWIDRLDKVITPKLPHVLEVSETKEKGVYKYVAKPFKNSGQLTDNCSRYYESSGMKDRGFTICGPFSRVLPRVVDIESRTELIDYLLSVGWIPEAWNYSTTTGERTSPKLTKDDPFEGVRDKTGKLVVKRQQCKHRRSSIEGLVGLIREDGSISAQVANLASTGRMTHRNVVNIPKVSSFFGKWMRKIFSSRPGKVLVGADSAGNQLRQFAARMKDPEYQYAVVNGKNEDGTDVHSVNMKLAGLPSRDHAKTFIYALLFGAGNPKIGSIIGGTANDGKNLRDTFMRRLPLFKELVDGLTEEWRKTAKRRYNSTYQRYEYFDGYIKGLDGRPVLVNSEHALLVYLLQSDEAIQMSAAYNIAFNRLNKKYEWGKQWSFVCFYHDEYTVECDPDIAEDVKDVLERSIVDAGRFYKIPCPHEGDGKIGLNWYEIH